MLLFVHGEKVSHLSQITQKPQNFLGELLLQHVFTWRYTIISNLIIAGNCESFLENEGKDMKQRNFHCQ